MKNSINIGISGLCGRMGSNIVQCCRDENFGANISVGLDRAENISTGIDHIKRTSDIEEFCKSCDIIIDFSSPELILDIIKVNEKYRKPIVTGTSGLTDFQFQALRHMAKMTKVFYCMNMSEGINVMRHLVSQATKMLYGSDVEILETHHNKKKDAPSGTAILLGEEVAKVRGTTLQKVMKIDRNGMRENLDIGFATRRGGSVVGEHSVSFYFGDEVVEITHRAFNRMIFARGAINIAIKLINHPSTHGLFDYIDLE